MPAPNDPFASGPDDARRDDPFNSPEIFEPPRDASAGVSDPFAAPTGSIPGSDPFTVPEFDNEDGWNASESAPASGRRRLFTVVSLLTILGIAAFWVATRAEDAQHSTDVRAGDEVRVDDVENPTGEPPGATTEPPLLPEASTDPATLPPTTFMPESTVPESNTSEFTEADAGPLRGCDLRNDDPHNLIRITDGFDRLAFCGEETWQVFVCTTRESDQTDRVAYVDDVLGEAAEWFDWASAGQYDIDFSIGDDTRRLWGSSADSDECFEEVLTTQWSGSRSGAVLLVDEAEIDPYQNFAGFGTCGYADWAAGGVFGESRRMAAIAVHAHGDQSAIAVHELGHAQCWPHSYSGETRSEYDNPADVMSAGVWPVGTIAVNRYASGWIHPEEVRVHRDSTDTYALSLCCSGGVQLLALLPEGASAQPVDFNPQWWHLEVRDPENEWERGLADAGVGEEIGVSVHWIDQRLELGMNRRYTQVGAQIGTRDGAPLRFGPLKAYGSEFCLHSDQPTSFIDCGSAHEWRIEVTASQIGGLNLTVSPGT